jgi:hypothetical protein
MRFSKAILIGAASLMLPLLGQADTVASDPTLMVGGLTFNNFSCISTQQGPGAMPTTCGGIGVQTITHPGTGIQFSSTWAAGSLFSPPSADDSTIDYHVSASGSYINKVGLSFDGWFEGLAISSVTESVFDSKGDMVGYAKVACDLAGCSRTDTITLNGNYSDLYIQKDINTSSFFVGYAQTSNIDQTFGTVPTPEPASIAMLGAGLLGVAGLLRRRVKNAAVKA